MNHPEQFWNKVARGGHDECWEWQGARTSSGYGNLLYCGEVCQAHRLAYMLANGGISPRTGFRKPGRAKTYRRFVLHKCDNRSCCNPAHLFLGSLRTNLLDAYRKGRKAQPKSRHANAKLSPSQVTDIRRRYDAGGVSQDLLAAEFSVSQRAISLVVRRETNKDVY